MHGQFIWYELTTPDVDAAIRFYPRFTGWGTQPFDNDYTMWTTGDVPFAGIFRLTDQLHGMGVPPNWMPYVESDDVDATVERARALGATVMAGPDDVPGVGRYAVLVDPQGAAFGVYKSVTPAAAWDGTPVVGRMSWHELMTTDHRAALQFYRALFGWEVNGEMDMGDGQMYAMYGHGMAMYGGMYSMGPEFQGMHPAWLCYIHVPDVAEAVEAATRAGAQVIRPQMEIPGGTIAILSDPAGAGFAVHDMTPAPMPERAAAVVKEAVTRAATAATKVAKAATSARKAVAKRAATARKKAARTMARSTRKMKKAVAKRAATARKKAAKTLARSTRKVKKATAKKTAAARRKPVKSVAKRKAVGTRKTAAARKSKTRPAPARRKKPVAKKAKARKGTR